MHSVVWCNVNIIYDEGTYKTAMGKYLAYSNIVGNANFSSVTVCKYTASILKIAKINCSVTY